MSRFFSPESFWNTPISPDAAIDARNAHYVRCLAAEPTGGVHINSTKFTIPVYSVDESTPRRSVFQRATRPDRQAMSVTSHCEYRHGPGFGPEVPIPDHAVPDPDSDSHAAFIDWKNRTVWDIWGGVRLQGGNWEAYTGMCYSLDGPGIFRTEDFAVENGDSIHYHGPSRAAGVPLIAGLIMHHEVVAGRIEHKLAFAARYNAYQEFTFPACWTDGKHPGGLPEGALVQLDPELDLSQFHLTPGALVICRALQEYGMVNVDFAAGTALYAEGLYYDDGRSWKGLFDESELKRIPMNHYRVIALSPVTAKGDARRGRKEELPW